MKALIIKHESAKALIENVAVPQIKSNQILIQNEYVGLNFLDIYIKNALGAYAPTSYPHILGKEGVGKAVEIGKGVKTIKKGDRVGYFHASGAFADFVCLDENFAIKIPKQIDSKIAVASLVQAMTAFYLVNQTYKVKKDDICLVHAASGGVGGLLIQMIKLKKAKVIATVSSSVKEKIAKKLKADLVINYTEDNFVDKTLSFTKNVGVNVIYDSVGKDTFEKGFQCLKSKGTMVSFGQSSGAIEPFDIAKLSGRGGKGSFFLTRPSLFHYTEGKNLQILASKVFKMLMQKQIEIEIGLEESFSNIIMALELLEKRKTTGKVVIKL